WIVPGPEPGEPDAPAASTAVVATIRLGELALVHYRVALYPLTGLSEASGRLQVGLVGHDVLQHYAVEIDYRQRRVRLFDPLAYRYAGTGATVPFSADADLPLLRGQLEVRGRRPIPARLLLDTGASGLCLILTTPFAEQHGLGRVAPAIEAPIGTGLVGDLHGTIVRLQQLRLAVRRRPERATARRPGTGAGAHRGRLCHPGEPERGGGDRRGRRAAADRRTRGRPGKPERRSEGPTRRRRGAPARAATRRGHDPRDAETEKTALKAGWWRMVEVREDGGGRTRINLLQPPPTSPTSATPYGVARAPATRPTPRR